MSDNKNNKLKKIVSIPTVREISEVVLSDCARVEIVGNYQILIENHKGILEYSEEEMKINCGAQVLTIIGDKLTLKTLTINELSIEGTIFSVDYVK